MLSFSGKAVAEIYRCNINGKVVFTDQPCDGSLVELEPMNLVPGVEPIPLSNFSKSNAKSQYNNSKWFKNFAGYKKALRVSKRNNAPILIYFQADWCGYCRRLEKELLTRKEVQSSLNSVVKVRITPEDGDQEDALFHRMGGTGYPTIFTQKTAKSSPKKRRLMSKKSGAWRTKSPVEFNQMLDAL